MRPLEGLINSFEQELRSKLTKASGAFRHPGGKGDILEEPFREILAEYLPRSVGVSKGEIIDSYGGRSMETDVVVVSDEHPFTFKSESHALLLIEGVMAAGEVKTRLTSSHLNTSLDNSHAYRTLKMHPGAGRTVLYNIDAERYQVSPPWFVFSMNSQLKLTTIRDKVERFIQSLGGTGADVNMTLDAVFVLDRGWLINFGDGYGGYRVRGDDRELVTGWHLRESKTVCFDFLAWLTSVMPRTMWSSPILQRYVADMPWLV